MQSAYQKIRSFKVYNSVIFILVKELSNHHHDLSLKDFPHPKRKPRTHKRSLPIPSRQSLVATRLLSVSMDLPELDISKHGIRQSADFCV